MVILGSCFYLKAMFMLIQKQDDGEGSGDDVEAKDNGWDNSGWDVDDFEIQQEPASKLSTK